ncbi:MAG: branched-chain amino acid ABC transporter permease [Acidimicrobiia bacterium]|nr:branched-chain amino acid ABC transporter permease [Acidimicrobiia bacterium]
MTVIDRTEFRESLPAASRLLPTRMSLVGLAIAAVLVVATPLVVEDDFWMTVLANAGAFAIAAIGLNILTGYAGQVSIGHAAFLTIGGYVVAYFGAERGWPLPVWLLLAALVGGAIGALVGPFALRFRGNYLVVVTLALLFLTVYVVENWESFTGGFDGASTNSAPLSIGPIDFRELSLFGKDFTREQGMFYLIWILVGATAVVARNLVRSRPGRAMQAIRDRDIAAEVAGVSNVHYKIAAFSISGAMAALGGAVYAVNLRFISPNSPIEELFISIRFVAIIIVGGLGTIHGAIVGALILGPLPELVQENIGVLDFTVPLLDKPFVGETAADGGVFTAAAFSEILFGVLLILFLMFQPTGIAGMSRKLRARLAARATRHDEARAVGEIADEGTEDPAGTTAHE